MATTVEQALAWRPPSDRDFRRVMAPLARWFAPTFLGTRNLSAERPTLFVGNHSVWSLAEIFLMPSGVHEQTGVIVRGLTDRLHFGIPGWRDFVHWGGGVLGDREITRALMREGQSIAVYPGGAREVFKQRGEAYRLIWKRRTGFVRLALEAGYTITPFGVAGGEECWDIVLDANDWLASPLGRALERLGLIERLVRKRDEIPPLVRGIGWTLLPKPQRVVISFGEPLDLTEFRDRQDDEDALFAARERVAKAVEAQLSASQLARERHGEPSLLRRVLTAL